LKFKYIFYIIYPHINNHSHISLAYSNSTSLSYVSHLYAHYLINTYIEIFIVCILYIKPTMSNFLELNQKLLQAQSEPQPDSQTPKQSERRLVLESYQEFKVKKTNKFTQKLYRDNGEYKVGIYTCSKCSNTFQSELDLSKPSYEPVCLRCVFDTTPDGDKRVLCTRQTPILLDHVPYECTICSKKFKSDLNFYCKGLKPKCPYCRSSKKSRNKKSMFYKPKTINTPSKAKSTTEWTTVNKKKRKKKATLTPTDPSQVSQYLESLYFNGELYPHGPYTCVFCEKSFNSKANLRGITNPNCDECYHAKFSKS